MFHTTSSHLPLSILLVSGLISFATARMFKVENKCSYTVWPAIFTDLNVSKNATKGPTGWEAPTGSSMSVEVPEDWTGRIWGRRDCNFNSPNPGPNSCVTGGCIGGLLCDPYSGTGVPPATLGEFRLSGSNGFDYYGISIVDGYNIPMGITTNEKCPVAECAVDLDKECPSKLKGPTNGDGISIGCKSACLVDAKPQNSTACCSGDYSTPSKCPAKGVPHYSYFKSRCPRSHVFAYDEGSPYTCETGLKAEYTVTFCPENNPIDELNKPVTEEWCMEIRRRSLSVHQSRARSWRH